MTTVFIDKQAYRVNGNEYKKMIHPTYNNLKMHEDLAFHQRLVGLIRKCALYGRDEMCKSRFLCYKTTHGGYIPIQVAEDQNLWEVILLETTEENNQNILTNLKHVYQPQREEKDWASIFSEIPPSLSNFYEYLDIVHTESATDALECCLTHSELSESIILICNERLTDTTQWRLEECDEYHLSNSPAYIYVTKDLKDDFERVFQLYLHTPATGPTELTYDNLINLCIMVKDGGPQFEQMLIDNLPIIDRWTILDTGSTDGTLDIIEKVLVGKKEGHLYQEPFINFRDSRNRLLELAGTVCKYNLMLDDTYVIQGDLREFLTTVRSDQYATSFTLFIHSDDTKYGSNRVIKSNSGLQYIHRIHEVISDKNNVNVVIPEKDAYIFDRRFDYMEVRTNQRKQLDLQLLFEELEEDPNNPRTYYYLAQTYNCLENYPLAFHYFMKRCEFKNSGFLQERVDAAFEAARLANFKLHKPWDVCKNLYEKAFKIDESRPEPLYFIGIHYYLQGDQKKAHAYFKQAFAIGFPEHCQYSLKPTLSYLFLPRFLCHTCYNEEDYSLGEQSAALFLTHNHPPSEHYEEMVSWYKIFQKLDEYKGPRVPRIPADKPIFCFVADGGFHPWTGSTILTKGVGGSETYIIEMARYIQRSGSFQVFVFCNTPNRMEETFEGVRYVPLTAYAQFIQTTYVKHVIVSRFSEYLPLTFKGFTENVYFVAHDLTPSGVVIPKDLKLKRIFCLTEWHVSHLSAIFPDLAAITVPFYYGIDNRFKSLYSSEDSFQKIKNKFIYSSFPNRGLLQLLQMWPTIYETHPTSTLHIYADVNHKWSNDVEPEKMQDIRQLLDIYDAEHHGYGIHYHGWVDKKELAESWLSADIWFYPCTFMETFCLTALEAASSNTLCVTNDLAALQNTVGNRGVIVPGDPTTSEWQEAALTALFRIMEDEHCVEKEELLRMNHQWSRTLSWEGQAQRMLNEHIYPNDVMEYKGMYNWTHDLPGGSRDIFLNVIQYFNTTYRKVMFGNPVSILEIGTYSGTSLIELVKRIPNSMGVGVDMWANYNENSLLQVVDTYQVKESFYRNVEKAGLSGRITGLQIDSTTALLAFLQDKRKFDFIYVDGSHLLLDCYTDMVLGWQVLEMGGVMAVDDYLYKYEEVDKLQSPFEGVNHFLKLFEGKYKLLHKGYRVFLEKLA
jgi:tetratricopeptide (TPR) repeat protein